VDEANNNELNNGARTRQKLARRNVPDTNRTLKLEEQPVRWEFKQLLPCRAVRWLPRALPRKVMQQMKPQLNLFIGRGALAASMKADPVERGNHNTVKVVQV
jgi:hypothetical protein